MSAQHDHFPTENAVPRPTLEREPGSVGRRPLVEETRAVRRVKPRAADAVARADADTGAPLPGALRERFEHSLGADLGAVRLHTGDASSAAASAVGAKAYTLGQNIHFRRGHYDPSSDIGQRLLAHEVAHTVQQGAAVVGPQFKLEVSQPHDHAEVEADAAADAMVSGATARVSPACGVARAVLQRDVDEGSEDVEETDYSRMRDAGWFAEHQATESVNKANEGRKEGDTEGYLGASNVGDRDQALDKLNRIAGYQAKVHESGDAQKITDNNNAMDALKDYMNASADQNEAQTLFKEEFEQVKIGSARLKAMFQQYFVAHGVKDAGSSDGTKLAGQVVTAGTDTNTSDAEKHADAMQAQGVSGDPLTNDKLTQSKARIASLQDKLQGFAPAISNAANKIMASSKGMRAAARMKGLNLKTSSPEEKEAESQVEGVKNDLAAATSVISSVGTLVKEGAKLAHPVAGAIVEGASSAKDVIEAMGNAGQAAVRQSGEKMEKTEIAEMLAGALTDSKAKLKQAQGKLDGIKDADAKKVAKAAVEACNAKADEFKAAVQEHSTAVAGYRAAQALLRKEVDQLNKLVPQKTPGQPNLGEAVALQSEANIFYTQCDTAIRVGEREREEAKEAKKAKDAAVGPGGYTADRRRTLGAPAAERGGAGRGLRFWSAEGPYKKDGSGPKYYRFIQGNIMLSVTPATQHKTQEAVDSSMDSKLELIKKMKEEMKLFVGRMGKITGIRSGF